MKYKLVVNQTILAQGVSAQAALNALCNTMQTRLPNETYDVKVYALRKKQGEDGYHWLLENGFKTR